MRQYKESLHFIVVFLLLFVGLQETCYAKTRVVEIIKDKDLQGQIWKLPHDVTLLLKGGVIKNGTIVGSRTKIKASGIAFDHVKIRGTWVVPLIKTTMFGDLDYENSLKDVFSLADSSVKNKIIIEPGDYVVAAKKEGDICIPIVSNTDVVMNGTVRMLPNRFRKCDIVHLKGFNITLSGNGLIIGDKHTHAGSKGEWGMGIRLHAVNKAKVKGLKIKDCWGDCIYIGGNSKNVVIEGCYLDQGRRQGISVTKANGVIIKNCLITNVSGTNPQYAIDLEPNKGDTVTNILIENVTVRDCEGGFLATRSSQKSSSTPISWIGKIVIKDCKVSTKNKYPIYIRKSQSVSITNCNVKGTKERPAIFTDNVKTVIIRNNIVTLKTEVWPSLINIAKKTIGKNVDPICVVRSISKDVNKNAIIER